MEADSLHLCAKQRQAFLLRCLGGIQDHCRRDMASRSGIHQERVFGIRDPVLLSPAAFLASSSIEALCSSLWCSYSTTPELDAVAAGGPVSAHNLRRRCVASKRSGPQPELLVQCVMLTHLTPKRHRATDLPRTPPDPKNKKLACRRARLGC